MNSNPIKTFSRKSKAIAFLKANPLSCVAWPSGNAIYWNGKIKVTKPEASIYWTPCH